MLVTICAVALLWTLAVYLIARGTLSVLRRLGLEPMDVLMWFGLAEQPYESRSTRR